MTAFGLGYSSVPPAPKYTADRTIINQPQIEREDTSPQSTLDQFLGQLLTYIPGDIVGLYLLITGFVPDAYYKAGSWVIFALLTPFSALTVYAGHVVAKRRHDGPSEPLPRFRMCAAPAAFVIWAISLPKSPFDSLWIFGMGWLKSIVLALGTFLIVKLADMWDPASGHASAP